MEKRSPLQSTFRVVSIGWVAENKLLSSKDILVSPGEVLPLLNGELRSEPTKIETAGEDSSGGAYQTSLVTDNNYIATWLPLGETNRRSAPDVRRGERVLIWQAADSDKYYWTSNGQDDILRKLETVIYTFSDTPDETKDSTAFENCYSLEISTHSKQVTFTTAKANGEPFIFQFQFNTADGIVYLKDDVGNYFEFNTAKTFMRLQNNQNSHILMDKKIIDIHCDEMYRLTVGGSSEFKMVPGHTWLRTPQFDGTR